MSRIPLSKGFMLIPEGNYVFCIQSVHEDEDFGKIEVELVTSNGLSHKERYNIKNADGEYNEKALNAFGYLAMTAMNDFNMPDIEPQDLVGHYFRAQVVHNSVPNRNDPTRMVTFVNLTDREPADGFDVHVDGGNNNDLADAGFENATDDLPF